MYILFIYILCIYIMYTLKCIFLILLYNIYENISSYVIGYNHQKLLYSNLLILFYYYLYIL